MQNVVFKAMARAVGTYTVKTSTDLIMHIHPPRFLRALKHSTAAPLKPEQSTHAHSALAAPGGVRHRYIYLPSQLDKTCSGTVIGLELPARNLAPWAARPETDKMGVRTGT